MSPIREYRLCRRYTKVECMRVTVDLIRAYRDWYVAN